jgi:hypothetical protein
MESAALARESAPLAMESAPLAMESAALALEAAGDARGSAARDRRASRLDPPRPRAASTLARVFSTHAADAERRAVLSEPAAYDVASPISGLPNRAGAHQHRMRVWRAQIYEVLR